LLRGLAEGTIPSVKGASKSEATTAVANRVFGQSVEGVARIRIQHALMILGFARSAQQQRFA